MKIKQYLLLILLLPFVLGLSSCMDNKTNGPQAYSTNSVSSNTSEPQLNTDNTIPEVSTPSDIFPDSGIIIENLPEELYIEWDSKAQGGFWGAIIQGYTFDVSQKTEFNIKTEVTTGDIKLSIKHKDSDDVIFDAQDTALLDEKVTLEEGTYCVVISGSLYDGYLHIFSN